VKNGKISNKSSSNKRTDNKRYTMEQMQSLMQMLLLSSRIETTSKKRVYIIFSLSPLIGIFQDDASIHAVYSDTSGCGDDFPPS
jgi:hypothetical protein